MISDLDLLTNQNENLQFHVFIICNAKSNATANISTLLLSLCKREGKGMHVTLWAFPIHVVQTHSQHMITTPQIKQ